MESADVKDILKFLNLVHNLKHTQRKGWEHFEIPNPERIAGHMYSMSIMTFLIGSNDKLDRFKCMQLALVHDLAECIVGDITPRDNVTSQEKYKLEDDAMKQLSALVGEEIGGLLYNLWLEYEEKTTPEAIFVKDLDRFDLIFTATTYEKRYNEPKKLQEFFDSTEGKFQHPFIKKLVKELTEERDQQIS